MFWFSQTSQKKMYAIFFAKLRQKRYAVIKLKNDFFED